MFGMLRSPWFFYKTRWRNCFNLQLVCRWLFCSCVSNHFFPSHLLQIRGIFISLYSICMLTEKPIPAPKDCVGDIEHMDVWISSYMILFYRELIFLQVCKLTFSELIAWLNAYILGGIVFVRDCGKGHIYFRREFRTNLSCSLINPRPLRSTTLNSWTVFTSPIFQTPITFLQGTW